jgi:drug/metabolite transporter (DMT)-like permease
MPAPQQEAGAPPAEVGARGGEVRAVLVALLGSSLVGSVPMFATGLYRAGMDVQSLLFWRYAIALCVLWPLAIRFSSSLGQEWRLGGMALFLNALTLGMLQTYTYFRAVEGMPSSVVVTIFFTYPILTLALDRFLFGKPVATGSLAAVALVFTGALVTGWPALSFAGGDPIAVACAILTPVGFSIYIAVAYRFTLRTSALAGAAFIYSGMAVAYASIVLATGLKPPQGATGWASVLWIAIVGGALQISSFAYALPRLSAGAYSIIISMELVTVVLLGVAVLGEVLSTWQAMGIALVAAGIVADRLARARTAVGAVAGDRSK